MREADLVAVLRSVADRRRPNGGGHFGLQHAPPRPRQAKLRAASSLGHSPGPPASATASARLGHSLGPPRPASATASARLGQQAGMLWRAGA